MRILAIAMVLVAIAAAEATKKLPESSEVSKPAVAQDRATTRVEGEMRFQTNCGRCHMPPHKFPPKMMATIVRHMRVRALITDEDMRYILTYMTE
jgi:mono/diheme cytochrome c family protein